jgi:hypothetical protein
MSKACTGHYSTQLAHAERNEARSAYNRAKRMTERRKMMQVMADYFESLRQGASITPLFKSA